LRSAGLIVEQAEDRRHTLLCERRGAPRLPDGLTERDWHNLTGYGPAAARRIIAGEGGSLAYLDDLLAQISDRGLGGRIASEIAKLRQRAQFGLVFERHLPEVVRLYGHTVNRGQLVQLRLPEASQIWRVRLVKGRKAQLEDAATGNEGPTMAVDDVVPVHTFGDPIYPGLAFLGSVHRSTPDRGSHVVVSGENYDVLQMLTHLHEGEVDCMYLDPPYNTGDQNWKYNNDYVDRNDAYRHSKWLSMMERRLRLSKRLLKPDGVIVVTIDAHEVSRLGVLLSQMFPSADIQMVHRHQSERSLKRRPLKGRRVRVLLLLRRSTTSGLSPGPPH